MKIRLKLLVLSLAFAVPAAADPILITGRSASFFPDGPFTLSGPDFSYYQPGTAHNIGGYGPLVSCFIGCPSGTTVDLYVPTDVFGNHLATYQGVPYTTGLAPAGNSLVDARFSGSLTLPDVTSDAITLTVPVTLTGSFLYPSGGGFLEAPLQLDGFAQAIMSFVAVPTLQGPLWQFQGGRYEITSVPEPALGLLLLLGAGLAGAYRHGTRQHGTRRL
jgi:hypothetical protein